MQQQHWLELYTTQSGQYSTGIFAAALMAERFAAAPKQQQQRALRQPMKGVGDWLFTLLRAMAWVQAKPQTPKQRIRKTAAGSSQQLQKGRAQYFCLICAILFITVHHLIPAAAGPGYEEEAISVWRL